MKTAPVVLVAAVLVTLASAAWPRKTDLPQPSQGDAQRLKPRSTNSAPAKEPNASLILAEYTFDDGLGGPDPQGWTPIDFTAQIDTFFHVDNFNPIAGAKSLWCGTAGVQEPYCSQESTFPGYGNNWGQAFESVAFPVSGDVELEFLARYDSETNYDFTYVQYFSVSANWQTLASFSGTGDSVVTVTIPEDSLAGVVKMRFQFVSDYAYSDEDGLVNTNGAFILDNISVQDAVGLVDSQDFEGEAISALTTVDGDWYATVGEAYGDHSILIDGDAVLQEDPLVTNATHLWGFFGGSLATYACGGHPEQAAVPYCNPVPGPYNDCFFGGPTNALYNGVASPPIELPAPAGSGFAVRLEFDVYRDLPLDNLVFYRVHVKSIVDGCAGSWRTNDLVYYGGQKTWFRALKSVTDLIEVGATHIQVAISAWDGCPVWCGALGSASCHSHAPLFDNVAVTLHEPQVALNVAIDFANPSTDQVEGYVEGFTNTSYEIRLYGTLGPCSASGPGPDAVLLATSFVTTDESGYARFTFTNPEFEYYPLIGVRALSGLDSKFSQCVPVPVVHVVTNTNASGAGSFFAAMQSANSNVNMSVISFNIPGPGPHTIALAANPSWTSTNLYTPILIDGFSQPGSARNTSSIDAPSNAALSVTLDAQDVLNFGISVDNPDCVLRGLNIIDFRGVTFFASRGRIEGCFISGQATSPNAFGVDIREDNCIVGGRHPGARNVISSNEGWGVRLRNTATMNQVFGNFIGVGADGTGDFGNHNGGVVVEGPANMVGGTAPGMRNVIAGNDFWQMRVLGNAAVNNIMEGNYIGVDRTGLNIVQTNPNPLYGLVLVFDGDSNVLRGNLFAGETSGIVFSDGATGNVLEQNTIWGNTASGVVVKTNTSVDNRIARNSIHSNGILGIDLQGAVGVTNANDAGDGDVGPNNLQNFPVLLSAVSNGGLTRVTGALDSQAALHTLEFFSNTTCDGSGYGEGMAFVGAGQRSSGNFTIDLPYQLALGASVTATAYQPGSGTSEFSACVAVINTPSGSSVSVTPVDGTTSESPVTLVFDQVTGSGNTTLTTSASGPAVPGTFLAADPPVYYHLTTTVGFSGNIEVCVQYDEASLAGSEANVRLLHYDSTLEPDQWVDVTTNLDMGTNTVCGTTTSLSPFVLGHGSATTVDPSSLPDRFALHQNVPNPFNPSTRLSYDIPSAAHVSIRIYDVAGRLVRTLVDESKPAGRYQALWNGQNATGERVASGVYFYRMNAGSFKQTRKMVLLK